MNLVGYLLGCLDLQDTVVEHSDGHLAVRRRLFQKLHLRSQAITALDVQHMEARVKNAREHWSKSPAWPYTS